MKSNPSAYLLVGAIDVIVFIVLALQTGVMR